LVRPTPIIATTLSAVQQNDFWGRSCADWKTTLRALDINPERRKS